MAFDAAAGVICLFIYLNPGTNIDFFSQDLGLVVELLYTHPTHMSTQTNTRHTTQDCQTRQTATELVASAVISRGTLSTSDVTITRRLSICTRWGISSSPEMVTKRVGSISGLGGIGTG